MGTLLENCTPGDYLQLKKQLKYCSAFEFYETDVDGWNVLHYNCSRGCTEIVKLILLQLYNRNIHDVLTKKDKYGRTVLHFACENNYIEIVKLIIYHPFFDSSLFTELSIRSRTPFHFACRNGYTEIVELFLKHPLFEPSVLSKQDYYGWTPLHSACTYDRTEVVRLILNYPLFDSSLLSKKVNEDSYTVLHLACLKGFTEIVQLVLEYLKRKCMTERFLVSEKDNLNCNILHCACACGQVDIVKLLLKEPFCIRMFGKLSIIRFTPLDYARYQGCTEIVQLLEKYKRDIYTTLLTPKTYFSKMHLLSIYNRKVVTKTKKLVTIFLSLNSDRQTAFDILYYL